MTQAGVPLRKLLRQATLAGVVVPHLRRLLLLLAGAAMLVLPHLLPLVVVVAGAAMLVLPHLLPLVAVVAGASLLPAPPLEAGPQKHLPWHLPKKKQLLQFLMPILSQLPFQAIHRLV